MKRLVSGIQPTGIPNIGTYFGAIKNFVKLANEMEDTEFLIFIADLHALTVPQDRIQLRKNTKALAALYLACGLRADRVHLFIQSEVPYHPQLGFVLECIGTIGEFERMTQYKEKKQKQISGISVGLLTYPALMAADILLYDAAYVPVGDDQKQHLEMTRNLAERFNARYGNTFVVPEPLIPKVGARIMSLQDPTKKMSKSDDNPKSSILLLDDLAVAKNKIKSAVTDSDNCIRFDITNKPGISNLMTLHSLCSNLSFEDIERHYVNKGYGEFKSDVADLIAEELSTIQARYEKITSSGELDVILDNGASYANRLAERKMAKVYQKLGIGRKK